MKSVVLPIVTPRLSIRKLTTHDFDSIFELCIDSKTGDWFPRWNMNREQASGFLDWQISKYESFDVQSDVVPFAIELRSTGTFIGHCSVGVHDELDETEISYGISKKHRGQGFATEAAVALTNWCLETFDIPYLIGTVEHGNNASMRVMEKSGFAFEGIKTLYYGGTGSQFNYYRFAKGGVDQSD